MLFQKPAVDYMLVGLGNPGKKYENTRHNAGFRALDFLAREWKIKITKSKFDALTGAGMTGGYKVLLLKPQTFMNVSGVSVRKAADFYKLPPERVIVLFDDISLPPGRLRIRESGSAGGHNGIKSILAHLGESFPRIKIGVGEKPRPEYDLADWVLGTMTAAEQKAADARNGDICAAAQLIMKGQLTAAQSQFNG